MAEQNLTGLKTLVISMGILLVIGFLAVMAGAWMKLKAGTAPEGKTLSANIPANCPGGEVNLQGRGQVVDMAVEGSTLRVALNTPEGQLEMVHFDVCSGKEIGALKITADAARPPEVSYMPPIPPSIADTEDDPKQDE